LSDDGVVVVVVVVVVIVVVIVGSEKKLSSINSGRKLSNRCHGEKDFPGKALNKDTQRYLSN